MAGGVAAAFGTEAAGLTQLQVVAYNFTVQAVGLVFMAVMAWTCVTATSCTTKESVSPPAEVQANVGKDTEKDDQAS